MATFFIFVTNLLNLYRRTLLIHNAFSLMRKQNQMNFERKNAKSVFTYFTRDTRTKKNLKKSTRSFQVGGHLRLMAIRNHRYPQALWEVRPCDI